MKKVKFDYSIFYDEHGEYTLCAFNKKLFSQAQAIEQARIEFDNHADTLYSYQSHVWHGFGFRADGEVTNSWWLDLEHITSGKILEIKSKVSVWVVSIKPLDVKYLDRNVGVL